MLFGLTISIIIFLVLIISVSWVLMESRKKKKQLFDFYAMFILGIVWLTIGIIIQNKIMMTTGVLFSIFGFSQKKEWDKEINEWHNLERHEKREIIELLIILFLLSLLGIVGYLLAKGLI